MTGEASLVHGVRRPDLLDRALSSDARALLRRVAARGAAEGAACYLVGGSVRDLCRGVEPLDWDVTVVGDAAALAEELAAELGVPVTVFPRFRTATLRHPALALDLASSRREVYPRPGARPEVTLDPTRLDLDRRDFTLNALALDLSSEAWGTLIDPLGGLADLAAGRLRVLHPASFLEDPTRILRGVRYHARLGDRFERWTEELLRAAVAAEALGTLDPDRLWSELQATLALGDDVEEAVAVLEQYGVLVSLGSCFETHPEDGVRIRRAAAGQRALREAGVRARGRSLPFVYCLLGDRADRRARLREVARPPARLMRRLERLASGEVHLGPGVAGRIDAQGAVAALACAGLDEETFAAELARVVEEYRAKAC